MVLLTGLPFDSSNFFAPYYKAYVEGEEYTGRESEPPKGWWKKEMDRIRGRGNRTRETVSLDEFMDDMKKKR